MQTPRHTSLLLNRLRFRQVALMLAIQEYGTLHGAANALGMTQSAASQMLNELEAALGEKLFDRAGRALQLNQAGQAVMNSFHVMQNNMTALVKELHELRLGGTGKLRLGCIMVAVSTHLNNALAGLKRRYPLLSIEIVVDTSDRLVELLRRGTLDIVIGRMPMVTDLAQQDCLFQPIGDETISAVVCRDHPLLQQAKKKDLRFEELLTYLWILQPHGSPSRDMIELEFQAHHAALPRGLIETTSILIATNLILSENMIAVIPESIAINYQRYGMLSILPYSFKHSLTAWGTLVYRDRPISRVTQDFIELLQANSPR